MVRQTVTLKLPFLRLNAAKATEFARLQDLNTEVANGILALSPAERSDLPTAYFTNVEIGSAWMHQTIRNARARTKGTRFKVLRVSDMGKNENPSRFSCSRGSVNV
jgi:putative transposase